MFILDDYTYNIAVLPGEHVFTAKMTFNRATSFLTTDGPYEATTTMRAKMIAGSTYRLNGEVAGSTVKMWIESSTGTVVSKVVTANYLRSQA